VAVKIAEKYNISGIFPVPSGLGAWLGARVALQRRLRVFLER
jgi:hypothetical protein